MTFAAFALAQASAIRASTAGLGLTPLPLAGQRSCVLRPSLNSTITFTTVGSMGGAISGDPCESACQPQARPMVWFVPPLATMALTLLFNPTQSKERPIRAVGQALYCSTGNSVVASTIVGVLFCTSLF